MKLIIDIPEKMYLNAKADTLCGADILVSAIKNGIPHETVTEFADRCCECGKMRKGHWITEIKSDLRGDMWPTNPKCSECGGEPYYSNTIYNYKFCPYCGAKIVEPQERSDEE